MTENQRICLHESPVIRCVCHQRPFPELPVGPMEAETGGPTAGHLLQLLRRVLAVLNCSKQLMLCRYLFAGGGQMAIRV